MAVARPGNNGRPPTKGMTRDIRASKQSQAEWTGGWKAWGEAPKRAPPPLHALEPSSQALRDWRLPNGDGRHDPYPHRHGRDRVHDAHPQGARRDLARDAPRPWQAGHGRPHGLRPNKPGDVESPRSVPGTSLTRIRGAPVGPLRRIGPTRPGRQSRDRGEDSRIGGGLANGKRRRPTRKGAQGPFSHHNGRPYSSIPLGR